MVHVTVNKTTRVPYGDYFIRRIVKEAEKRVGKFTGGIEINIVSAPAMKKINHEYRNINKVTDVLSFAWREEQTVKSELLGQIYVCYPRVSKQAMECGVLVREEFARICVHGLLHLLGHEHAKPKEAKMMFAAQEDVVKSIMRRDRL